MPPQLLHGHPDAGKIWTEDLLVRGFNEDLLRQMLETVAENVSYGFSVLEVGAKDANFTNLVRGGEGGRVCKGVRRLGAQGA